MGRSTKTLFALTLTILGLSNASCEMFNRDDRSASNSRTDTRYADDSRASRDARVTSETRYDGMTSGVSGSDAYDPYFRSASTPGGPYAVRNEARSSQVMNEGRTSDLTAGRFVEEAASAGLWEVQSSELALRRGVDSETREFAQRMIRDHGTANQELTSIARQRGIAVNQRLSPRHQRMLDELDSLSGEQFTQRYRQMQTQAHEEAIDLFRRASRLSDSQLRSYAQRTLPTLKEHRDHVSQFHANVP